MNGRDGFAVWLTGLPASGKSSIARLLAEGLRARNHCVVILESDAIRTIMTPHPMYSREERDTFYRALADLAAKIVTNGVDVLIDATAQRKAYRDRARTRIPKFVEAYVQCPLDICMQRDPKGIYRKAISGEHITVPGLQTAYEPPLDPEVIIDCQKSPETSADAILDVLKRLLYI